MPASRGVLVRIGPPEHHALVRVPLDRFVVASAGRTAHIGRGPHDLATAEIVDEPYDPAQVPVTGLGVASLTRGELTVLAEGWEVAARRALRNEADLERRVQLNVAMGHARVLRALSGDVRSNPPTARDFDVATAAGLLIPRRLHSVPIRPDLVGSPLERQRAQGARVAERVEALRGGDEFAWLRSRSGFAGITAAAALVLTGCSAEPNDGDRRCVDEASRVVDDDNCRTYGGTGVGGFYYRYGGSTYSSGSQSYLRNGNPNPSSDGDGFSSQSGSGS